MNNDIQRYDIIQNYLDNKMSAAERAAFEAEMATDASLAEEVGVHRVERELMDIMLEDDLDEQMRSWQQEKEQMQLQQPKRLNWKTWAIIAVVCIVMILLLIYLLRNKSENTTVPPISPEQIDNTIEKENNAPSNNQPQAPEKKKYNGPVADSEKKSSPNPKQQNVEMIALAEEFGGTPEFAGTFVRSGEEAKTRFDSASVMIQEKRYDQAIRLLQTISNEDPETYLNTRLNLGYLYFIKKNYKASIPPLEFAAANKDYLYAETADWYLALAYLANGQQKEFDSKLLTILADAQHAFYQKAVQLKKRLEEK